MPLQSVSVCPWRMCLYAPAEWTPSTMCLCRVCLWPPQSVPVCPCRMYLCAPAEWTPSTMCFCRVCLFVPAECFHVQPSDKAVRYHNFSSKGNLLSCGLQAGANISILSLSVPDSACAFREPPNRRHQLRRKQW